MATAVQPEGSRAFPFLAGLGLAVAGFLVVVNAASALGYGKDLHALRVAALTLPLFAGGVIAFWPGRNPAIRAGVLALAVATGTVAWLFTPSEFGGMSLAQAIAKSSQLKAQFSRAPTYEDVAQVGDVAIPPELKAQFPGLAESTQQAMTVWATAAGERIAEQYRSVPPDSVKDVSTLAKTAEHITKWLPPAREGVAQGERAFSDRSAEFWAGELNKITPGHFTAFLSWTIRRDAVTAVLPNGTILARAELAWVERSVESSIERAYHLRLFMPKRGREELLTTAKELQLLSRGAPPEIVPFRTARLKLFAAALANSQSDAHALIEAGAYDRALGLARTYAVEWSGEATSLGPDAVASLTAFREGCRYLSDRADLIGDVPEFAPPPRTKP